MSGEKRKPPVSRIVSAVAMLGAGAIAAMTVAVLSMWFIVDMWRQGESAAVLFGVAFLAVLVFGSTAVIAAIFDHY